MANRHLVERLTRTLSELSVPVRIRTEDSEDSFDWEKIEWDKIQTIGQEMCLPVKRCRLCLCCSASAPGVKDILQVAAALATSLAAPAVNKETALDVYRLAMLGEMKSIELENKVREYQIPESLRRYLIVFQVRDAGAFHAWDLLEGMIPIQNSDVLIDMNKHTAVLIREMEDDETTDEAVQFCEALHETLISEAAIQTTLGISGMVTGIHDFARAYQEANRAVDVGRCFQPESSVYAYDRLLLERLLLEIPPEAAKQYHELLFNSANARLFNEEMLNTIDMFFSKDLNLSDTARQLYIHRNTLVYRLDKVKKQTGLDLCSFKDALTFKLLMELKRCEHDT